MNENPVLVIGALGNVGAEIVKALLADGVAVRAADIKPDAVSERFGERIDAVYFNFADPETYGLTLQGIKRMFLMRPPQITDVENLMFPLIDAAKNAGVEQVVFLSLIGIEGNKRVPHYKVEQYLKQSAIPSTMLRCSFFMQNLNTTHREEIAKRDEIFVPVGAAKTSFLDVRDIGAVAAVALTQPGHAHREYDLTGGEALDYYQVANIFSEVLGRQISYKNPSGIHFFFSKLRQGTPLPFSLVMTWLYSSTKNGVAAIVTSDVERLSGRKPITFRQYVSDFQDCWK